MCGPCDKGRLYCPEPCAKLAEQARVRSAGAKYRATPRGRKTHRDWQRRDREKQRAAKSAMAEGAVTHRSGSGTEVSEGIVGSSSPSTLTVASAAKVNGDKEESHAPADSPKDPAEPAATATAAPSKPRPTWGWAFIGQCDAAAGGRAGQCALCGRAGRVLRDPDP